MNILVITDDRVGQAMAGSALRAWELGLALTRAGHAVRIAAAERSQAPGEGPQLVARPCWGWAEVILAAPWCLPPRAFLGRQILVIDGTTPLLAELAATPVTAAIAHRQRTARARLPLALARADAVLAAGEAQIAWWQERLLQRPQVPVLAVPFGIPEFAAPTQRDEIAGVPPNWAVVLWWGGVWPWLDLDTLLAARARLGRVPLSLVVPTAPRPGGPLIGPDEDDLLDLAADHDLEPPQVVPLATWVPYDRRHRILNRASLLAVLHHAGEEAELCFRTRALDGIWAGVPLLLSEGGAVAGLTREHGWGGVVTPRDVRATAAALELLLGEREQSRIRAALAAARPAWRWSQVVAPLVAALPKLPGTARGSLLGPALKATGVLLDHRQQRSEY